MGKSANRYTYRIEGRDLDFTLRPSFTALADYILQAAGEDADCFGFGVRELNREDCSWVLSKMAVEINQMPAQYQTIEIATWVNDINRLMTTRNFIIYDQQGNKLGAATTQWAMLNLSTRLPMDLRSHTEYTSAIVNQPSPIGSVPKIQPVCALSTHKHQVAYTDIDFNQHANSMKYVGWMMNMIPIEWHSERSLQRFDINFIHEARYGDHLEVGCSLEEVASFDIKNSGGISICRATMKFV